VGKATKQLKGWDDFIKNNPQRVIKNMEKLKSF
jgi:hypothetical protein